MKILVCPDKFKGSITAKEFCEVAKEVFISDNIELVTIPLADGGEGSLDCIENHFENNSRKYVESFDAFERPINSYYLMHDDTAYIELALQSGLTMISLRERDVMNSTTYGTGKMFKHAIESGVNKIYLFVGGSATNDGGLGIARSCGYNFYNYKNVLIGNNLSELININKLEFDNELDLSKVKIILATDVKNKLLGDEGATKIFGPQKGVNNELFHVIENGLSKLNDIIAKYSGVDASMLEGSGAAGGVAVTVCGLMKGKIVSATDFIFKLCNLENHIKESDLVITGEGKFDAQSLNGKLVGEVIKLCKKHEKKCVVVCGKSEINKINGIEIYSLSKSDSYNESLNKSNTNLKNCFTDIERAFSY